MAEPSVELVRVPCLGCGNRNRRARRACPVCEGAGYLLKHIPTAPEEAP
jgi:hypothetical protein